MRPPLVHNANNNICKLMRPPLILSIYLSRIEAPLMHSFLLQILCSFENTFNCSLPNQSLAALHTFSDLLKILDTLSSQQQQPTTRIFPNIKDDGTLPPNLSIQYISTAPRTKPNRSRFQNYDARRPEHASFLSKQEREKRKQKRRHLTVWKGL